MVCTKFRPVVSMWLLKVSIPSTLTGMTGRMAGKVGISGSLARETCVVKYHSGTPSSMVAQNAPTTCLLVLGQSCILLDYTCNAPHIWMGTNDDFEPLE